MHFIFPKNYDFKTKLFGFINYSTAIINIVWYTIKLFVFVLFCFPLFLLSLIGFQGENVIYVLFYFLKFIFSAKLYLYDK